jgi:hypothetical protein
MPASGLVEVNISNYQLVLYKLRNLSLCQTIAQHQVKQITDIVSITNYELLNENFERVLPSFLPTLAYLGCHLADSLILEMNQFFDD